MKARCTASFFGFAICCVRNGVVCPEGTGPDSDSGECVSLPAVGVAEGCPEGTGPDPDSGEWVALPEETVPGEETGEEASISPRVRVNQSNLTSTQMPSNTNASTNTSIALNDTTSISKLTNETSNVNQTNSTDGTFSLIPSIQDRRHAPS